MIYIHKITGTRLKLLKMNGGVGTFLNLDNKTTTLMNSSRKIPRKVITFLDNVIKEF